MDVLLPGKLNGIESAQKIRAQTGIPVIFMTGYSDEETRRKARTARPADYFIKPLNYDRLKEALASIMRQKK
jgi:DNA-binding response OmpR family regulator